MAPLPHFPTLSLSPVTTALDGPAGCLEASLSLALPAADPIEAYQRVLDPNVPADLVVLSRTLQFYATFTVLMFGVVIWDTLSTLNFEYRYIWKSHWSLLKVVYLINRYWTPVCITFAMVLVKGHWDPSDCSKLAIFHPIGAFLIILGCDCIVSIRIHALYNGSRKILWILVSLLVGETIIMAVVTSQSEPIVIPPEWRASVEYYGCAVQQRHDLAPLFWGGSLIFEVTCLVLFLHRILALRRASGSLPILTILLRNGVFYFLVVFLSGMINISLLLQPNKAWQVFNPPASVALMSLMASRMVLSLHFHKNEFSASSASHRAAAPTLRKGDNTYPPAPTTDGDQKAAIPLGAAFSALSTAPLKNSALELSMDFADAGDISRATVVECEPSCDGASAGSSPVKNGGGGRQSSEGARSTCYPEWTNEADCVRFVDLPRPAYQPSHGRTPSSSYSSTSTSSSSSSRPVFAPVRSQPVPSIRPFAPTPAATPYISRPSSPPSLTALPTRSFSFPAAARWAPPSFARRLSPIPSAGSHCSSFSGGIAVERETVVTVGAGGEDEEEGKGWERAEVWTGQAL
ncbi:hypothetical protein JCM6882_005115 [Rhodosporidiobolus microsporus]